MNKTIITKVIKTPIAEMLAGVIENTICMLEFTDTGRIDWQLSNLKKGFKAEIKEGDDPLFSTLSDQLGAYFDGGLKHFDLPLSTQGTSFQQTSWDALCEIPYGETRSYHEQAIAIGKPKAFRAVASSNRNNRISIIIPCHRVIAKSGQLAGYGGGLDRKAFLISHEKSFNS